MAARTFRVSPGRQFRADGPVVITCLAGGEIRIEPVPFRIAVVKPDSGVHNDLPTSATTAEPRPST